MCPPSGLTSRAGEVPLGGLDPLQPLPPGLAFRPPLRPLFVKLPAGAPTDAVSPRKPSTPLAAPSPVSESQAVPLPDGGMVELHSGHSAEDLPMLRAATALHFMEDDRKAQVGASSVEGTTFMPLAPAPGARPCLPALSTTKTTVAMEPTVLQSSILQSATASSTAPARGTGRKKGPRRRQLWTASMALPARHVFSDSHLVRSIASQIKLTMVFQLQPESSSMQGGRRVPGKLALVSGDANCLGNAIRIIQNAVLAEFVPEMRDVRLDTLKLRLMDLVCHSNAEREIRMTNLRSRYAERFGTELIPTLYGKRDPTSLVKLLGCFSIEIVRDDKLIKPAELILSAKGQDSAMDLHCKMHMRYFSPTRKEYIVQRLQDVISGLMARHPDATMPKGKSLVVITQGAVAPAPEASAPSQISPHIDPEFAQCLAAIDDTGVLEEFLGEVHNRWRPDVGEKKKTLIAWLDETARRFLEQRFLTPRLTSVPDFVEASKGGTVPVEGYTFGTNGRLTGYFANDCVELHTVGTCLSPDRAVVRPPSSSASQSHREHGPKGMALGQLMDLDHRLLLPTMRPRALAKKPVFVFDAKASLRSFSLRPGDSPPSVMDAALRCPESPPLLDLDLLGI
uniref:Uncharacterized protein n=1 Tax=Rhizochromulina marina TaxID=1034831 RepID=A0A7S2SQC5_9STRA|mmetsp:Transcript_4029/g.11804  ORF Transcript_4029/g.11804 Transcript_4029/m.11804 type:complete len:623 (+) Transcript_4029:111-1979(+)